MAMVYERIDPRLREFMLEQPVFFVATAPGGSAGHVNVSPKGMRGSFAVLDDLRVAYCDYTGSGAETIAHLRDNGRITIMFCAFTGPPTIVRLHGHGRVVRPGEAGFDDLRSAFAPPELDVVDDHGLRSIIVIDVHRVSDSCGFAVPFMDYAGDRTLLTQWAQRKSADDLVDYRHAKNSASLDGLPALG